MGGLCSCFASCLAWCVQQWSLLAIGWSWVLVLRWRSLGELSPIIITWGQEVSGSPMSWTWPSHLGPSGPHPAGALRSCQPHNSEEKKERKKQKEKKTKRKKQTDRTLGQMVKANLYRQNHTKKHTHTHSQKEKKEKKNIYIYKKKESNPTNKQIYQW